MAQTFLQELRGVNVQLADRPEDVPLLFQRACLLARLGDTEPARDTYLRILGLDPAHLGTLNNLGALLFESGCVSAARIVYTEAIAQHPDRVLPHVNLGNLLVAIGQPERAETEYLQALRCDPQNPAAHQGLCVVYKELGDAPRMHLHRAAGFAGQPVTVLPYLGEAEPLRLLVLLSSVGGSLPWRHLVDDRVFATTVMAPLFFHPSRAMPEADVVFNTIGDADSSRADLLAATRLLHDQAAPVINPPDRVLATGRVDMARRLRDLPGLVAPHIATLPRDALLRPQAAAALAAQGFAFPLLLRRAGFHTGKHFVRIDSPDQLAEAASAMPEGDLMLIQYLDATGPDGQARKYRVMFVGGRLYPLHLAISADWKVHYFSAAMAGRPAFQAEEEKFLADMPAVLGTTAMAALRAIRDELGLDYAGVDFGLDAAGRLLLFEANATMLIQPPDADPQWNYRRPAIERALAAARAMLFTQAKPAHMRDGSTGDGS